MTKMTFSLPRPTVLAFLFTSFLYLACVSYISFPLTTFLKPIPILCLMIGVLQTDLIPWAKKLLLTALGFSLLGDIILSLPITLQMELGILCFLLAHCCYIFLLLKNYKFNLLHLVYFIPVIIFSGFMISILLPHLGALKIPVIIYFFVLLFMVLSAFQVKTQRLLMAVGALSFMLSDSILAYNMFVMPQVDMIIVIMFDYYLAQFLLTLGFTKMYAR